MAICGLIADIHGNLEALVCCVEFLEQQRVDRILCLGDIVGYNADPNECIAFLRARGIDAIAGNHDLISIGQLGFDRCSNKATFSLKRTRKRLTPESAAFLERLPLRRIYEDSFAIIHGGIYDVELYMRTRKDIQENGGYLRALYPDIHICFYGHTHEQKVYEVMGNDVIEHPIVPVVQLQEGRTYFVNPGSVDASRKAYDKFAECVVFDSTNRTVAFHRLPYDYQTVERKARANGYRIDRLSAWVYSWHRRIQRVLERARLPSSDSGH